MGTTHAPPGPPRVCQSSRGRLPPGPSVASPRCGGPQRGRLARSAHHGLGSRPSDRMADERYEGRHVAGLGGRHHPAGGDRRGLLRPAAAPVAALALLAAALAGDSACTTSSSRWSADRGRRRRHGLGHFSAQRSPPGTPRSQSPATPHSRSSWALAGQPARRRCCGQHGRTRRAGRRRLACRPGAALADNVLGGYTLGASWVAAVIIVMTTASSRERTGEAKLADPGSGVAAAGETRQTVGSPSARGRQRGRAAIGTRSEVEACLLAPMDRPAQTARRLTAAAIRAGGKQPSGGPTHLAPPRITAARRLGTRARSIAGAVGVRQLGHDVLPLDMLALRGCGSLTLPGWCWPTRASLVSWPKVATIRSMHGMFTTSSSTPPRRVTERASRCRRRAQLGTRHNISGSAAVRVRGGIAAYGTSGFGTGSSRCAR